MKNLHQISNTYLILTGTRIKCLYKNGQAWSKSKLGYYPVRKHLSVTTYKIHARICFHVLCWSENYITQV